MKAKHVALAVVGMIIVLIVLGVAFRDQLLPRLFTPTQSDVAAGNEDDFAVSSVATNLETPWSVTFLPGGDMLVTERGGQLRRIGQDGTTISIDGVRETSEGGLLGLALDPNVAETNWIYLYYTTERNGRLANQVDRYRFSNNELSERTVIIDDIPAATNHNGGAVAFGPDGKLYITTGDAAQSELAQDTSSLAGKILRINPDGTTPNDNPFDNSVWSYGHRNPQGLAWDDDGQLWSVEHGPSGVRSGRDELNRIEKGVNYGWPVSTGDEQRDGMVSPVVQSGDNDTWAPSGLASLNGSLYFAGLRGQALYRAVPSDDGATELTRLFAADYGRLRAVTVYEGDLYVSTSNRDGRGTPHEDDDQILRITP